MKLPKSVDKCDQPESRWLRLFNFVASDLKEGVTSCQCCIFWRGFALALAMFIGPVGLALAGWWFASGFLFTVIVGSAWIVATSPLGEP